MISRRLVITIAAFALSGTASASSQDETTVKVESGELQGVRTDDVISFKGIPYAAPPVGEWRWRPPQPAKPWDGIRPADDFGAECMQGLRPGRQFRLSEDCLFLNIWRPADLQGGKLPVMVYIFGGGLIEGGSSLPMQDGTALARQGVVSIGINYRLGRFGFFGFPSLTKEHPEEPHGNYGVLDQIAALQWVKRNVAAFGGDPDNVTIFGQSAGGSSVHMLLMTPLARGLFNRGISHSGGAREMLMGNQRLSGDQRQSANAQTSGANFGKDLPMLPSAETLGVNFARKMGIEGTDAAALAKLRALSADAVTDGLGNATVGEQLLRTFSGPMIDGKIILASPEETYKAGAQAHVPLIIGATSADIGFSFSRSKEEMFAQFGALRDRVKRAYDPDGTRPLADLEPMIWADQKNVEPSRFVAGAFAAKGIPSYEYRFSYVPESKRDEWRAGAPHTSEMPFVFGTLTAIHGDKVTPRDEVVSRLISRYWVNFARTGNPNGPGLPRWPVYTSRSDTLMDFRQDGTAAATIDPWKERLDIMADLAEGTTTK